jgi:hypothetical protein
MFEYENTTERSEKTFKNFQNSINNYFENDIKAILQILIAEIILDLKKHLSFNQIGLILSSSSIDNPEFFVGEDFVKPWYSSVHTTGEVYSFSRPERKDDTGYIFSALTDTPDKFFSLIKLIESSQIAIDELFEKAKQAAKDISEQIKKQFMSELDKKSAELKIDIAKETTEAEHLVVKGITSETKAVLEKEIYILESQIEAFKALEAEIKELEQR